MRTSASIVAALLFALATLIHLYRLYAPFDIVVGDYSVPLWTSGVGAVITTILSYWLFSNQAPKTALIVAGLIFAAKAIFNFANLYYKIPVILGGYTLPLWSSSIIGGIIGALLCYWMFASLCCSKCNK